MMQTYTLSGRRSASRYASQDSLEDARASLETLKKLFEC